MSRWKDTLGIFASVACAIHCAVTPVFLAFLPSLRLTDWMASPQFHQIAAMACVSLVAISIWPAFARFRDYRVLGLSSLGLSLVLAAAFLLPDTCCSQVCDLNSPVQTDESKSGATKFISVDSSSQRESADEASQFVLASVRSESESISAGERLRLRAMSDSSNAHAGHDHSATNSIMATIQPWMTPFGGLFLVLAHGLNLRRRKSCSGKCACKGHVHSQQVTDVEFQTTSGETRAA